uniref:Argininosuccinate lyase, putative / arginosuccinase, putative n=1 Tax=Arundo donax TaxID=35708 RepID=A0A0A9DW95_ARUDO
MMMSLSPAVIKPCIASDQHAYSNIVDITCKFTPCTNIKAGTLMDQLTKI